MLVSVCWLVSVLVLVSVCWLVLVLLVSVCWLVLVLVSVCWLVLVLVSVCCVGVGIGVSASFILLIGVGVSLLTSLFTALPIFTVTSSGSEASLSSTTVSLNVSVESAADSGTSKLAVCVSDCLSSISAPPVCSHLYETISPSWSELLLPSRFT